jgi:hypothetical protein
MIFLIIREKESYSKIHNIKEERNEAGKKI